jgi:prepilin-type N-terminal cleavage/methylation domain-containing protein
VIRIDSDDGFTLTEMAVTVGLLGLVLATAFGAMTAFTGIAGGAERRMRNLEQARLLMNVTTRDLRTATPTLINGTEVAAFVSATADSVEFYGNLRFDATTPVTDPPVRVRLFLETDPRDATRRQLVETVTALPTTAVPSPAPRRRVIGVSLLPDTEMFCYDTAEVAASTDLGAWCASSTVPALADIAMVRVRILVQRSSAQGPTVLISSVYLPNVALDKVAL